MNKIKIQRVFLLTLVISFLSSCNLYPDDDARVDEFDAVITYNDITADFGTFKTYAIVDSVREIDPDGPGNVVRNSDLIIDLINQNMQSRGYVLVPNPNDADLGINAGAITVSNIVISGGGYPGYWWGYPGDYWGYPGYGWGYPYYPVYVTEYEVGTLVFSLIDLKNIDPNQDMTLAIPWASIIRGVTGITDNADIRNRLKIDINIAFEQSPYLSTNL